MQPKQDEIYRSRIYGDDIRLIIDSVNEEKDIIIAYVYDKFILPSSTTTWYHLSNFYYFYEPVEG